MWAACWARRPHVGSDNLCDDLGWDSLHLIAAIVWIEEQTAVMFPEQMVGTVAAMGDLYEIYRGYMSQGQMVAGS